MPKLKKIVLLAQKGGVGKTTAAVHLSTLTPGSTVLIDTDGQRSASKWHARRAETAEYQEPGLFDYATVVNFGLDKLLARAERDGREFAVIDTPPSHSHPSLPGTLRHADVIVMPIEPSILSLDELEDTLSLARATGKPIVLVVNKLVPREREAAETLAALEGSGLKVVQMQQRVAFKRSLPFGQTVLEYRGDQAAVEEVRTLWTAVETALASA